MGSPRDNMTGVAQGIWMEALPLQVWHLGHLPSRTSLEEAAVAGGCTYRWGWHAGGVPSALGMPLN